MSMVDDDFFLSEVNNPIKSRMDEEKAETTGMGTAEKCDSIPGLGDSSQCAWAERNDTVSMEGKPAEAKGGEEGRLDNLAAEGETGFIVDTVAEMNESAVDMTEEVTTAVEGGDEIISGQSENPPLKTKADEEFTRADDAEEDTDTVITDTWVAPILAESKMCTKVDELLVDMKFEGKAEEEFASAVDAKLDMVVSDSEPPIETKADEEFNIVLDPKEEVFVNDVGDTQQLSELQMDVIDDGFQAVLDALHNEFEVEQVSNGKNNAPDNQPVDNWVVDNNSVTVVEGDKVNKEKVDTMVNDSEVRNTEKLAGIEEGNFDAMITTDILTEVNACVVGTGEQEQVHATCEHVEDKHVTADKIMEDDSMPIEVLGDSMLDEPVNMSQNKDAVVKVDLTVRDMEAETKMGVELGLTRNVVVDDTQLDDVEDVDETEVVADKTSDDDYGKMEREDTNSDADEPCHDFYETSGERKDEAMVAEEEIGTQDTEIETETDIAESGKSSGGKRKRGKFSKSPLISKATMKASSRKTVGEDVCFICFDGGELVLCDRRGCPKAYHPSCVNRDEAFFKSKGRWNCGWHLCSICEKNSRYMCFTCTFSLCKSCTKDAIFLCVQGNKGFCDTCMRTVELIEKNELGNTDSEIDFDDRSSWEYLFKDYYLELKAKLSLSSVEIAEAKNPWKGADVLPGPSKQESSVARADANDGGSGSDDSVEIVDTVKAKRRRTRKSKTYSREVQLVSTGVDGVAAGNSVWASNELLKFVSHMKDGDTSYLSQFDVQALLLEYIKRKKLRDPRRKSQIICDARLGNLFGKPRVGHFEMLKLLESHFLVRDEQNDDFQGSVVDTENNQLDNDGNADPMIRGVKDRKHKSRKNRDPQSNLDDYAAIDIHNIGLIYLRRKLMEDLLEDAETFHDKVIGTFVRIRISGSNQKQDLYRLVPVVGTSKAAERYKIGKKSTDTMVEILNLDKTEIISIDTISNQEFTEDECKRLRQSIRCGLISRMTVGEILDKTIEIQVVRVNDWLESEVLRLSHLRDRASDLGHRKELRECVEKLQLLRTPEDRRRRLEKISEIHADPKMDPCHESDDNDSENEDTRRNAFMRSKGFSRRGRAPFSPGSLNSTKVTSKNWESSSSSFPTNASHAGEKLNENSWNLEREKEIEKSERQNFSTNFESRERAPQPETFSSIASVEIAVQINESEKMWHYKDPSGKMQGPFSVVQLRKWNNTGYFPADLRIWRATEKQDKSILLTDALEGKYSKQSPAVDDIIPATSTTHHSLRQERSEVVAEKWRGSDTTNLPSPTPKQSNHSGWDVEERRGGPSGAFPQTPGGVNPGIQTAPFSPTPNSQQGTLVNPTVEQPAVSPHMHVRHPPPVQTVASQNLQDYGWGAAASVPQNSSGSFSSAGAPTMAGVWGPPQGSQPNMPSPATPNGSWGMWPPEKNTPAGGVRPENPNIGWSMVQGNDQNMGWGNLPPGGNSVNMNWGGPSGNNAARDNNNRGPMPGYVNPGWGGPPTVQGPVVGNGWDGWAPKNGNAGTPSGPPPPAVQGQPPQENTNQGGSWGGVAEQNHMGGQFSDPKGGRGRDSCFSGRPQPWNRQSSYGGGSSRKRDMVCPYNAKGRCVKGVRCNYLHT